MQEKIKQVIISNLEVYLTEHLKKISEDKHNIAKQYFYNDMQRIIDYCYQNFEKLLSEDFIKLLHKNLYPEGYIQKAKNERGEEFIWMIPGEYKKIEITSKENNKKNIYEKVEKVESSMKKLINDFNLNISKTETQKGKKDLIILFTVNFISIHPFGDGNGRLDGVLIDLLCLKYDIIPFGLVKIYKQNKADFTYLLKRIERTGEVQHFYDFIETQQKN